MFFYVIFKCFFPSDFLPFLELKNVAFFGIKNRLKMSAFYTRFMVLEWCYMWDPKTSSGWPFGIL